MKWVVTRPLIQFKRIKFIKFTTMLSFARQWQANEKNQVFRGEMPLICNGRILFLIFVITNYSNKVQKTIRMNS